MVRWHVGGDGRRRFFSSAPSVASASPPPPRHAHPPPPLPKRYDEEQETNVLLNEVEVAVSGAFAPAAPPHAGRTAAHATAKSHVREKMQRKIFKFKQVLETTYQHGARMT